MCKCRSICTYIQSYNHTIIQPYNHTTIQPYNVYVHTYTHTHIHTYKNEYIHHHHVFSHYTDYTDSMTRAISTIVTHPRILGGGSKPPSIHPDRCTPMPPLWFSGDGSPTGSMNGPRGARKVGKDPLCICRPVPPESAASPNPNSLRGSGSGHHELHIYIYIYIYITCTYTSTYAYTCTYTYTVFTARKLATAMLETSSDEDKQW